MKNWQQKIENFLWAKERNNEQKRKTYFLYYVRVVYLAAENFLKDKGNLFAAGLTFFSLLSLVPILALAFAVAKGFGLDKFLEKQILSQMANQGEAIAKAIEFAHNLLQKTRGEVIAGVGVIFLFWTVIKVFSQIESAFNQIWGVDKGRSWARKFTDYLSLFVLVPFLFISANSLSLYLSKKISLWALKSIPFITTFILPLFKLTPLVLFSLLFTLLYIVIPSTEVRFKPAFISGVIVSIFYFLLQKTMLLAQINLAKFNAIYGSFAALPLFVLWINWSWSLVLLGAEVAFVLQNFSSLTKRENNLSLKEKKYLCLYFWAKVGKYFLEKKGAMPVSTLNHNFPVTIEDFKDIESRLLKAGLIKVVCESEKSFLPAYSPHNLTVEEFWEILEKEGKSQSLQKVEELENKVRGKRALLVVDLIE